MTSVVCILGVDPGLKGALAFYFPRADKIAIEDMPVVDNHVDAASVAARVRQFAPTHAIVEQVSARPGQGVSSTFKFGEGYGMIIGVVTALEIPLTLVSPAKWKKVMGLNSEKAKSRAMALRQWPARADLFGRVKDDGRAEAALLAKYMSDKVLRGADR